MNPDCEKKTCRLCCMEIPRDARKCPRCHHFQNRLTTVMYHPAAAVLFACIPLGILMTGFTQIFDRGEDYQLHDGLIEIAESEITFGETKSGGTVAVIGTAKNKSSIPWKEVQFQVEFHDATGRRTDVGQQKPYSLYFPPNAETAFKISFQREFPETNYAQHTVRILAAKDGRARW